MKNIGSVAGAGLSLSLAPDSGIELVEGGFPAFDAPLPAGEYESFSLSLRHPGAIAGVLEEKGVAVTVTNGGGESWDDRLPVRVFRDTLMVGVPSWNLVPSENLVSVSGLLPGGKIFYVDSAQRTPGPFVDGTLVRVSLAAGEDSYTTEYQLMANISGREISYLPAIYNRSDVGASVMGAHEPNDSVAAAEAIEPGEIILAGLSMDAYNNIDLDYYLLRRPATPAPVASFACTVLESGKEPIASAYDPSTGTVHGIFANDGTHITYSKGSLGDSWNGVTEDPPPSLATAARAFVGLTVEGSTLHAVFVTEATGQVRYAAKTNGGPWQEEDIGAPSGMGYADNYRLECRISGGYLYALAGRNLYRRELVQGTWSVTAFADPIDPDAAAGDYYAAKEGRLLALSDGSVLVAQNWEHKKPGVASDTYVFLAKADGNGAIVSHDLYGYDFYAQRTERHFSLEVDPQDESRAWLSIPGNLRLNPDPKVVGSHVLRLSTADPNDPWRLPYAVYSTAPPHDTSEAPTGGTWPGLYPLADGGGSLSLLYSTTKGLFAYHKKDASTWKVQEVAGPGDLRYADSNIADLLYSGRGWALFKTLSMPSSGPGTFKLLLVNLP